MGVGLSDGMVVETVSLVEADTLGVLVIESVVAGVGGSVVGPGVGKTELGGGGGEGGGGGGVIGRRVGVGAAVVGISVTRIVMTSSATTPYIIPTVRKTVKIFIAPISLCDDTF